ncbi:MAG: hypothetical protein WDL87_01005 [Candidatus Omnitrophota bacterium]|jgi:hypothetical protein
MKKYFTIVFILFFMCAGSTVCVCKVAYCQDTRIKPDEFAGELSGFGVKVTVGNYYFIKRVISVFGTRWGQAPATDVEFEDRTWEQLLLSYEAFRRDITVSKDELEQEVSKTLKSEKVAFDWQNDKAAYDTWLKEKTGETSELFENQLRHLIQLEKLRQQVLDTFKPSVTEAEAYQEFLNEYNTLELELVAFDEKKDADAFYAKMRDPALWDEASKKDQKFGKHPGFVSLEFLINMWKIPKDDLYKMLDLEVNSIYPPIPVYKGYGVIRILKKRLANKEDFPKLRDSYLKQVEMIKKYDELNGWLGKLKAEAKILVYPKPAAAEIKPGKTN